MKKYLVAGLLLCSVFIAPIFLSAQSDIDPSPSTSQCITLNSTALRYRSGDIRTNGEVSLLQNFLQSKGYLGSEPTGFFGLLTLKAVKDFQQANGINPTGFVGSLTKAKIKKISCNNVLPTIVPSNTNYPPTYTCGNPGVLVDSRTGIRCGTTQPSGAELDAKIKAAISSIRAAAEVIYSQNNPYSYKGVCSGEMLNSNNSYLTSIIQSLNSANTSVKCYSSGQQYAVSATLSNGTLWCVDSTGISALGSVDNATFSCKNGQTYPR